MQALMFIGTYNNPPDVCHLEQYLQKWHEVPGCVYATG